MKEIFLLVLLFVANSAQSEVVQQDADGFQIKIETRVQASAHDAYRQFLRVDEWWVADHTWFGDAKALRIEAKAGGCFCEQKGDRQVLHMLVSYVDPGKEIRLIGGLGPLQMMGVQGGMRWQFVDDKNGGSKIIQTYTVTGSSMQKLDQLAAIVDKVQTQQQQSLAQQLGTH